MTSSLIRGKYVIAKITGPSSADVVTDGAVLQQDGPVSYTSPSPRDLSTSRMPSSA